MKQTLSIIITILILASCHPAREIAIVAHRGYWNCEQGGNSHNSIASLRAAQDLKVWGSEFDVTMTADSVLIVYHDYSIAGKVLCESNWTDLADHRLPNGEAIPTLDEYLTQFEQAGTSMVFELKGHRTPEQESAAVEKSLEMIKSHGLYNPARVTFISFSIHACEEFARLAPGFEVQYLGDDITPAACKEKGLAGIDTYMGALLGDHTDYVEQAHNLGMTVNCWTVDDTATMRKLIEIGVDQITTNCPEAARGLLQEMKIKELKVK